jgi:hypothetical protein
MDELSDLERLVAVEEIKALKARRDRALDKKDWASFEALHAPDILSENAGRAPWTSAAELTAQLRRLAEGLTTIHHSHTPDITVRTRDRAEGVWTGEDQSFWRQGETEHWFREYGFYHETYRRGDSGWTIASRRFECVRREISPGGKLPFAG